MCVVWIRRPDGEVTMRGGGGDIGGRSEERDDDLRRRLNHKSLPELVTIKTVGESFSGDYVILKIPPKKKDPFHPNVGMSGGPIRTSACQLNSLAREQCRRRLPSPDNSRREREWTTTTFPPPPPPTTTTTIFSTRTSDIPPLLLFL